MANTRGYESNGIDTGDWVVSSMDTTGRVGAVITTWLSRGGPEGQLLDWLRGYDLPVTGDEEPYLWLARGLEVRGDLTASGGAFCERVKAVLESRPDRGIPGRWPERVLYNLYMLCACLHCPACLAEPLLAIYRDRPADRPWRGLVPREALRTALVENQLDTTLHQDWRALLEGRRDYLPGDPEAGFEGILKMHPSRERLDEPVVESIVDALTWMVRHLDDQDDREDRLQTLLDAMVEEYPNHPTWDHEILHEAVRRKWPLWSLESLPICTPNLYKSDRSRLGLVLHLLTLLELSQADAVVIQSIVELRQWLLFSRLRLEESDRATQEEATFRAERLEQVASADGGVIVKAIHDNLLF